MISIIDYGMGNLGSVKRKLDLIGEVSVITSNPKEIMSSNKIILPGVGHFARAVSEIKKHGLWSLLSDQVLFEKKPVLGICLGMQLMARNSEEGDAEGFGWIDARVVRFQISDTLKYKVPHMGWNSLDQKKESPLLKTIDLQSSYYFVHSYHLVCNDDSDILARTYYESSFVSAIQKNNIYGTQFHPEKSHEWGEKLMTNFVNL